MAKVFRVSGKFQMGSMRSPFSFEVVAPDVKSAHDRVLATLGSRHRANRHQIWIEKEVEIPAEQVQEPSVRKQLSMVK